MQTDYQQTFIEWRAKIVLEVGNQIIFVVVVSVIYLIGNFFFVLVGTTKIRNGHFLAKWGEMGMFLAKWGQNGQFWAKWACST